MKKSSPTQSQTASPVPSTLPGLSYMNEVWRELKKVDWPSQEQTTQQTLLVVAVSVVVALYLGGLDFMFTQLTSLIIQ